MTTGRKTIVGVLVGVAVVAIVALMGWHDPPPEQRAADDAALAAAGALVARDATIRDLRAALDDRERLSAGLRERVAELERRVPGARPAEVRRLESGVMTIPCPPTPSPAGQGGAADPPPAAPSVSVIAVSDEVRLDTASGAAAVVGEVALLDAATRQEYARAPWRADVGELLQRPAPRPLPWSVELRGGLGTRGLEGGVTAYGRGRFGGWAQCWWHPASPDTSAWGAAGGVSLRIGRR